MDAPAFMPEHGTIANAVPVNDAVKSKGFQMIDSLRIPRRLFWIILACQITPM
jgi:hypothetical protein